MKKHNTLKVVLITLIVFLVLSWIFPAAYYSGEYVDQGRIQTGLADVNNYFMTSLSYFGYFALYLILVGCFYGVLYKIPAYRAFLDRIVAKVDGKVFIALTVVLFALGVSIAGLQIGFAIFVPLVVSVLLLMGYDKIVAAMTVAGSLGVGLIGSTYAYSNNNLLTSILGLEGNYQIGVRFVILIVGIVVLLFNIFMYIKNTKGEVKVSTPKKLDHTKHAALEDKVVKNTKVETKKTNNKSKKPNKPNNEKTTKNTKNNKNKKSGNRKNANKAALRDENIIVVKESINGSPEDAYLVPNRVGVSHKIWPFVAGFILLFILLVLAWITWGTNGFGVTFFDTLTDKFVGFELFGFPIFNKIYGTVNSFGNWTLIDLFLPVAILLVILMVIYKVKLDDALDGMVEGAKKALLPAFIIVLLYTLLVIVTYHPYQMCLYKAVLGLSKGFNIATTVIVTLLSSVFNVDPAYAYQAVLPYLTSIVTKADNYPLVGIISQSMYGFSTLFAPSSIVLMTTLAYLKISYKDWFKNVWKVLLELFVLLLIIFIILALI